MKRQIKTLNIILLFILLLAMMAGCASLGSTGGTITIAVVENDPGTRGNPNPQSIYAGVLLAANEINDQGGVGGQRVVVEPYSDQGDATKAQSIAKQVADSNAVAVIGHSSIETSNSAAVVYDEKKIPVIGVIPGDARLATNYSYYFNLSYTANQEAAYLANYVIKVLDKDKSSTDKSRDKVTIIYTNDEYGKTLKEQFTNTFRGLGGKLASPQLIKKDDASLESVAAKIAALNSETENPGTIFIATDEKTAASLLIKMRRKGVNYPVIGASNLGGAAFVQKIKEQGEEKAEKGYFTNGILATRSIIFDSANEQAGMFYDAYQSQYKNAEPGDLAANGYDAALTLFAAVQKTDRTGSDTQTNRNMVYESLLGMDSPANSVQGLTGQIYFDPSRKAVSAAKFGVYQDGQLISATTQFEPVANQGQADNSRVISVNGEYVYLVNVVYAGVDVINISDVDIKTSTYKMDFYLWFRYRGDISDQEFKPTDFIFLNGQDSIESNPIGDPAPDPKLGLTTSTYRVTGIFKNQFSFYEYPFDIQSLPIQFRNQNATSSYIQYAVDRLGMKYTNDADLASRFAKNGAFNDLYGWNQHGAHSEQTVFSTSSTLGNPQNFKSNSATNYSLIKMTVDIKRASLQYIIKSLLPLLITLILAYITFFLPLGHSERLGVGSTALLTTAFFHLSLASELPEIGYTVAMEYLFYASYTMSALIVLLETLSVRLETKAEGLKKKADKDKIEEAREKLNLIGRIVYPAILIGVLGAGALVSNGNIHLGPESEAILKSPVRPFVAKSDVQQQVSKTVQEVQTTDNGKVTLHLSTWRPEDVPQFQVILSAFHQYALTDPKVKKDITVVYDPVMSTNYDAILNKQLAAGGGPDLFYVRPFSVDGSIVRYLTPLKDLDINQHYEGVKSSPWQDHLGAYYALPFAGVVQGVYYNKDMFKKFGIEPPKTWDEFLTASKKIQENNIIPVANTLNDREDSEMFQSILANFVGGVQGRQQFMSAEGSLCFTNNRIVNAFSAVSDLRPYLYLPSSPADRDSNKSKDLFFNGKAAMLFGGSWDVTYFTGKNLPFAWSVFAVPAPSGDPTVIFHPDSGIGINRNSGHPQETKLFMEWLMKDEAVKQMVENLPGFYPLRMDVNGENKNIHAQEFLQLTSQYPTDARWAEISISAHVPKASDLIRADLFDMAYNDLTAYQAAKRLQDGLAEWYTPAQTCK